METMKGAMQSAVGFVADPLTALWTKLAAAAPAVLTALVLLVLGAALGKLTAALTGRVLRALGVDALAERVRLQAAMQAMKIERSAAQVLGSLAGLFVFTAFLLSALDAAGLGAASDAVRALLLYLPKVVGAIVVLIAGLFVARWAGEAAERAAQGAQLDAAKTIGRVVQGLLAVVVTLLALKQMALEVGLIAELLGAVVLAATGAAALALGLGGRRMAGELIAGAYVRDLVKPGDRLELGELAGEVVEVGAVKTTLRADDGALISLPNGRLLAQTVRVRPKG